MIVETSKLEPGLNAWVSVMEIIMDNNQLKE